MAALSGQRPSSRRAAGPSAPYDQRLAQALVGPLARSRIHPNAITALTAALALAAALGFADGRASHADWAAGVFVLSRFLDHCDGALARYTKRASRLGYVLDYLAGGLSYAALFAGIAIGQARGELGALALSIGALGALAAMLAVAVNMAIDRRGSAAAASPYPRFAGFELEDGIYLLAPVTWLGWLTPFFVLAALGALVYLLVRTFVLLRRALGHSS